MLRVLHDDGMAADWACDGQSGQQALAPRHYSLALLDIGLPDKFGFDVLEYIRAQENPIPLLPLTARDSEDSIRAWFHVIKAKQRSHAHLSLDT